jgi:hypothetical protein
LPSRNPIRAHRGGRRWRSVRQSIDTEALATHCHQLARPGVSDADVGTELDRSGAKRAGFCNVDEREHFRHVSRGERNDLGVKLVRSWEVSALHKPKE